LKAGVIAVPVNILYKEREAGHILADARPRAVVVEGASPAPGAEAWRLDALMAGADSKPADRPALAPSADDPAALIYTSGTTGAAKGAILTHRNFAANAATLVEAWRFTDADRLLVALPLFHVHGLGNAVMCWLASGCRARLLPRFDQRTVTSEFLDFRPTVFFGVPTMYVRLLEVDEDAARRVGGAARLFVSGSAPLSPQTHEAFEARYGHRILERYGMTETLMTLGNPYDGERRAGTVGRPFPGVSIRIVDGAGLGVADGEAGELLVRSAAVCAGYWNRPDATAASFTDGWFRTGDMASRSPDGYVTLRGRQSDLIISGGFNIYPREIEELLAGHDAVAEAAVAGVPDPARGEVPVAFVVPAGGGPLDASALEAFCRAELASFKVPRAFVAVDALPRTALGKVRKKALVEAFGRSSSRGPGPPGEV
jgi:malonyl-CoA/methylmalonyl-CoA synthetase